MEARVVTLEKAYAAVEAQLAQLQQAQVPTDKSQDKQYLYRNSDIYTNLCTSVLLENKCKDFIDKTICKQNKRDECTIQILEKNNAQCKMIKEKNPTFINYDSFISANKRHLCCAEVFRRNLSAPGDHPLHHRHEDHAVSSPPPPRRRKSCVAYQIATVGDHLEIVPPAAPPIATRKPTARHFGPSAPADPEPAGSKKSLLQTMDDRGTPTPAPRTSLRSKVVMTPSLEGEPSPGSHRHEEDYLRCRLCTRHHSQKCAPYS
ncbi:PREDICTED: uncharacterized protein LOC108363607 [Rhagoletis zephyria]|uniref:uncharacterized protein LOC108363607 n=1 Tax=Rhagoletis zephyria TaxID=28612 RepID=UPI00081132BB|nr:PREDICTED: uncharacterized protein LOC108363607 [Rhagoletis zephyria]